MESNWLNLMYLLAEMILILIVMAYHLKNKKYIDKLIEEQASEFINKIDSNNLVYEFKTGERSLKGFRDGQRSHRII